MNAIAHLKDLFAYNDWANRRLIVTIRTSECRAVLPHMSHVLATEKEYCERLFGKDSTGFDFWPDKGFKECSRLAKENAERFEDLLAGFDDEGLGQVIEYRTSGGTAVRNCFRDILTHVVLHSMNHRGQILTLLRGNGVEPPRIDYIIYRREIQ